jgi:hypothetical protein
MGPNAAKTTKTTFLSGLDCFNRQPAVRGGVYRQMGINPEVKAMAI